MVEFIDGSVTIDGITATDDKYIYNKTNHTLTINLDNILPYQSVLLSFSLRKRINTFFVLNSFSTLHTDDGALIKSNTVTVVSPRIRRNYNDFWCGSPKWRT